jgi:hypothetical protein
MIMHKRILLIDDYTPLLEGLSRTLSIMQK